LQILRKYLQNNLDIIEIQIVVPELSCAICHVKSMQEAQDNSGTTKCHHKSNKKCVAYPQEDFLFTIETLQSKVTTKYFISTIPAKRVFSNIIKY
jgi:hypothetical protein